MDAVPATISPDGRRVFRLRQAAAYLNVSEATVRREIDAGRLPHVRIRAVPLVPEFALEEWLRSATR